MPSSAAESLPSPSTNDLYRIDSEYLRLSEFPNRWVLYDVLMIDIDAEKLQTVSEITANLYLPLVPEDLNDIVLFDGWHVAHFTFERVDEGCIRIKLQTRYLAGFDGTVGLYLFVTGYED